MRSFSSSAGLTRSRPTSWAPRCSPRPGTTRWIWSISSRCWKDRGRRRRARSSSSSAPIPHPATGPLASETGKKAADRPIGTDRWAVSRTVKARLQKMPAAKSMQQIAQVCGQRNAESNVLVNELELFRLRCGRRRYDFPNVRAAEGILHHPDYPADWRVYEPTTGSGVTIAPETGYVDNGGAERDLIQGVIINHYDPFNEGAGGDDDDTLYGNRFPDPFGFTRGFVTADGATGGGDRLAACRRHQRSAARNPEDQPAISGSWRIRSAMTGSTEPPRCPWCSPGARRSPGRRSV